MAHPISQSMGVIPPPLAKNTFYINMQFSSAQFDSVEVLAEMASHPITHFCRIRDAEMEMVPPPPPPPRHNNRTNLTPTKLYIIGKGI